MAMRILAVLAAALLVGAFALATLADPALPLGHALFLLDHRILIAVQDNTEHTAPWLWNHVAVPMLMRPVWFVPVALGLICGGCAFSLSMRQAPRSRQRRS